MSKLFSYTVSSLAVGFTIICLNLGVALAMTKGSDANEDMQFVDAIGDTGYYVDVNSINSLTADAVEARFSIIKLKTNQRFIYETLFNFKDETYQITHVTVEVYGTREVISDEYRYEEPHSYSTVWHMQMIADFVKDML